MVKYDSYKDSGIEWIGEVPKHWNLFKVKYLTKEHRQGYYSSNPYDDDGYKVVRITDLNDDKTISIEDSPYYQVSNEDFERFRLENGDFLFPRTGGVGRFGIFYNNIPSIYGSFLIRFRFNDIVQSGYLKFYFDSSFFLNQILQEIHGGVNQNVHVENIKGCFVSLPKDKSEQHQIVQYLDNKTTLIDTLIQKTQEKINLLREKRTSLINHTVTKGLNPDVEMKDSGVEWIGEIPKHWETSKFKYHSEIVTGNTPSKTLEELYYTSKGTGYPWVKPTNLDKGFNYVTESDEDLTEEGKNLTRLIPKDSIMICSIGNTLGKYGISGRELSTNQQINSVICDKVSLNPRFCMFFTNVLTRDLINWTNFVTLPIFTKTDLEDTEIIVPPIIEQQQIVEYLDEQSQLIDTLIQKEEKRVELLKEYRQTLISDVVTGKIKVTDYE